jgi:hypothetical protein
MTAVDSFCSLQARLFMAALRLWLMLFCRQSSALPHVKVLQSQP